MVLLKWFRLFGHLFSMKPTIIIGKLEVKVILESLDHLIWTMVGKGYTPPIITVEGARIRKLEDK